MAAISNRELFMDAALLDFEDPAVRERAAADAHAEPRSVRTLRRIVAAILTTSVLVAAGRLGGAPALAVVLVLIGTLVALARRTGRPAASTVAA